MNVEDPLSWLSVDFWKGIVRGTMEWAVQAIPKVLVIFALAFVLLKLLSLVSRKIAEHIRDDDGDFTVTDLEHEKRTETLIGIVQKAGQIAIWALVLILLLMQVGVEVAPLIAGAGIVGLAVGFGAQELVRDLITGFFMLLENQIRKGDVAIVNGTGGLVESIGLRTVRLRDLSGVVHVFQNGKISSLANMTKDWSAMVFEIGIAYKENTDQVTAVVRQVADDLMKELEFGSSILEPLEIFGVDSFGDSAVTIKARFKTRPGDQWTVGREFNRRLKMAFDEHDIEIPFPHRTLTWSEGAGPLPWTQKDENGSRTRSERAPSAWRASR